MIGTHQAPLRAPRDRILELLHAPEDWPVWLPALEEVDILSREPLEVVVRLLGPRPLRIQLHVERLDAGLHVQLVQGDVSALDGSIRLEADQVSWELEVQLPMVIPPSLVREFDEVVLPSWLDALQDHATGGSDG